MDSLYVIFSREHSLISGIVETSSKNDGVYVEDLFARQVMFSSAVQSRHGGHWIGIR